MVDGKFRFSLDISQITDLKIKTGNEYSDTELDELETESQFGKLYGRALEYCLMRPHSAREVRDYLYRKTLSKRYKSKRTGEIKERPGVSKAVTERVFERLVTKGYIDDQKFARFWVENRNLRKGVSRRKLEQELSTKGVDRAIITAVLSDTERNDGDELGKVIAKKINKYDSQEKLIVYLMRRGFNYDDIRQALSEQD